MRMVRLYFALASASALIACDDAGSNEVSATIGHAPLAEARPLGDERGAFTGRFLMTEDVVATYTSYSIDLADVATGQPITSVLGVDERGREQRPAFAPGEFYTLALIEHAGAQNLQLERVRLTFGFETDELVFERGVSAILRSDSGQTYVQLPIINGLGETQLIQQSFQTEAALRGVTSVDVELSLSFEGTSLDGAASFASTTTFPLTICANCDEFLVPEYASGVILR